MKATQLNISFPKPERKKPKTYRDLNIHEKINIKSNSSGFEEVYLRNPWQILYFSQKTDMLNNNWFWHYRHNYKRSLTTRMWLKNGYIDSRSSLRKTLTLT